MPTIQRQQLKIGEPGQPVLRSSRVEDPCELVGKSSDFPDDVRQPTRPSERFLNKGFGSLTTFAFQQVIMLGKPFIEGNDRGVARIKTCGLPRTGRAKIVRRKMQIFVIVDGSFTPLLSRNPWLETIKVMQRRGIDGTLRRRHAPGPK